MTAPESREVVPYSPEPPRLAPQDQHTSARYAKLPRRDTIPEVELRRALWRAGYRYRVQYKVPGIPRRKVDIAFTRRKVAVQVDGCFWHGCPEHGTVPGRNSEWWKWKIARNQARDRDTDDKLTALGWTVIHVWEHDSLEDALARVAAMLSAPPPEPSAPSREQA
ncbi:MAG: very short patch repair endonuclease [Actinomyces urogenitalis]|uniref:very short patch repair endonuclease n=1 Tax=Actinomyces urogenitalis TaxID=103621 RepID=UPI002A8092DD|nr:very short patch repair endonuclease [Actinomyces urogenitalis]MDY3679516.1 very short patch repair endonuclease [Actinomyces urogenitalis]